MKKNAITGWLRWAIIIAGTGLASVIFLPIWRIELSAPQYPEGLVLRIFAGRLGGNVDIINGLNHYIGMKTLHSGDFIEFLLLPYIISFFAAAFILTALLNKRKLVNILFAAFVAFGVIAMVDFWRWEYNYGHNLNPDAAIIVPGMAYQPPLIGYKQLLNFGAYSVPDIGGWIFVAAGAILFVAVLLQFKTARAPRVKAKVLKPALLLCMVSVTFFSCKPEKQPIIVGEDNCSFCKMTFTDARFGGEILTTKGKVYKFDDMHCLLSFMKSGIIKTGAVKGIYVVDFLGKHELMPVSTSFLLASEVLHTPMNGNIAAFASVDSLDACLKDCDGKKVDWSDLINQ
ncbi:MAG TPA: hypothetical protein VG738_18840 [Chitinophagaceae bacterium]|nr:hypothetical protein [Chitinophagaceae bacterium]